MLMIFPPPLLLHNPRRLLEHLKHAGQHQGDDPVPLGEIELHGRLAVLDARAVHEDVEPAEAAGR